MAGLRLSPEEGLLVAAVGGRAPVVPVDAAAPVDWQRLLDLAAWHRALPLLWQHLKDPGPALDVPAAVVDALRGAARASTARSVQQQDELARVLAHLHDHGIPVVLLKGAALLELAYPHPGLRPMGDLDLLVPRADVGRAHDLVQQLGYEVQGTKVRARDDDAWLATIHHHLPLVRVAGAHVVELHHRILVDRPGWDVEGVWARATPSPEPPPHLLPAPEDLLLHVAVHFALDRMNRAQSALGQLADVVHLARRRELDWHAIEARARAAAVADRLFLALESLRLLVGDVAPPEVVERLRPAGYTARRGEQVVRQRVLRTGASLPLEQLAGGRRRLFGTHALEVYVRPDEVDAPSHLRLRARRFASIGRRAARLARRPGALVDDVRLSRWMLSLKR